MLAKMFSEDMRPSETDENGAYIIDRNGELFAIILEFLRTGNLWVPTHMRKEMDFDALQLEATYYGLDGLLSLLSEHVSTFTEASQAGLGEEDEMQIPFSFEVTEYDSCKVVRRLVVRRCVNCGEMYLESCNKSYSCKKPKMRKGQTIGSSPHVDEGYAATSFFKRPISFSEMESYNIK
jgi:hypothetical protein